MTLKTGTDINLLANVFESINENGLDGMLSVMAKLLNEVMKIERSQVLAAAPYERSEERQGYANGYKDKTIQTRMGPMTALSRSDLSVNIC